MTHEKPLSYRLRSEIEWTPIRGRRREWWVAIDPMRSQVFRCGEEERRLLQWLDGRRSIHELQQLFAQNVAGKHISLDAIQQIVSSAIQKQLLIPVLPDSRSKHGEAFGQPSTMTAPTTPSHKSNIANWLKTIQRWPYALVQGKKSVGSAKWFLAFLDTRTDWLFSRTAVRAWMVFFITIAVLVLSKLAAQTSISWPSISSIRSNATSYLLILFVTRILHELGHAIVCTRMGARCREFGVFFMLGIACPYVDVTDSWRLKDHRQRMAVAAAGVYVELVIAAIAGLVWYAAQPGWLPTFAWQVMIVCSVTTLVINANPLMRYDGYFLLSDFLEVTNLREEAEYRLKRFAKAWLISDSLMRSERWPSWRDCGMIAFATASWLYRSSLVLALVWAVAAMAAQWKVPMLGWAFAGLSLVSFLLIPIGQMMFQSWVIARRTSRVPLRLVALWFSLIILIANIGWIPLPHRIACQGLVQPEKHIFVYTQTAGRIPLDGVTNFESAEDELPTSIVELENPWLADQAHVAAQHQRQLECQIAAIRQASYQQPAKIDQLPALAMLVAIAEKQSLHVTKELDALTIVKPDQGSWVPIFLPATGALEEESTIVNDYTIEDKESCGRWLPAGTPIGYVAPSDRVSISMTIPISQLSNIQEGMFARVRFDQQPDRVFSAHVTEISGMTATQTNMTLAREANKQADTVGLTTNDSQISISLSVEGVLQKELAMGGTADVVIWSQPKSLYQHAMHLLATTIGPNDSRTVAR